MHKPNALLPASLLTAVTMIAAAQPARAMPITFTEQVSGSGQIGSFSYSGPNIVLTMPGDTASLAGEPPLFVDPGSVTAKIGTRLSEIFTVSTAVGNNASNHNQNSSNNNGGNNHNNSSPGGVVGDTGGSQPVSDGANGALDLHDPSSSGAGGLNSGQSSSTDVGLSLSTPTVGQDSVAAPLVAAVPEPGSLALLGAGLIGFGLIRRRNRSRPRAV